MDFHKQLVQIAHEMDWEDLTDHGSGSCVASHGCAGVTQSDLYEYGDRIRAAVLAESAPPSDLVALLREALEVLPGRGNLRRRIIQTIGESDAPPSAEPDAPPRDNKAMSGTRSETIAPSSGSLPNTSRPAEGATTQNPYQQFAEGNHSIGIIKDGKLIATDEQVYAAPSSRVSVPRLLLYDIINNAATGYPDWTTIDGRIRDALAAAPPAPDEDGERIAALTAERDRLREDLHIEQLAYKGCDARATEAEAKLREVEAALRGVMDLLKGKIRGEEWWASWERINKDAIGRALAPERTVARQEPTAEMYAAGYTKYVELSNLQGYIAWRNIKECFAAMLTAAPPSPLLPGLERAAEIADKEWRRLKAHGWEGDAFIALQLAEELRAEISRLKGEGSGS